MTGRDSEFTVYEIRRRSFEADRTGCVARREAPLALRSSLVAAETDLPGFPPDESAPSCLAVYRRSVDGNEPDREVAVYDRAGRRVAREADAVPEVFGPSGASLLAVVTWTSGRAKAEDPVWSELAEGGGKPAKKRKRRNKASAGTRGSLL